MSFTWTWYPVSATTVSISAAPLKMQLLCCCQIASIIKLKATRLRHALPFFPLQVSRVLDIKIHSFDSSQKKVNHNFFHKKDTKYWIQVKCFQRKKHLSSYYTYEIVTIKPNLAGLKTNVKILCVCVWKGIDKNTYC